MISDLSPIGRIGFALQDSVFDQSDKPVGQDVAGNPQGGLEFLEMGEAIEGATQNQEGPALADGLQCGRKGALFEDDLAMLGADHGGSVRLFRRKSLVHYLMRIRFDRTAAPTMPI